MSTPHSGTYNCPDCSDIDDARDIESCLAAMTELLREAARHVPGLVFERKVSVVTRAVERLKPRVFPVEELSCTEAERRVLDATAKLSLVALRVLRKEYTLTLGSVVDAELARRGAR